MDTKQSGERLLVSPGKPRCSPVVFGGNGADCTFWKGCDLRPPGDSRAYFVHLGSLDRGHGRGTPLNHAMFDAVVETIELVIRYACSVCCISTGTKSVCMGTVDEWMISVDGRV